jgi:hypothetical protein
VLKVRNRAVEIFEHRSGTASTVENRSAFRLIASTLSKSAMAARQFSCMEYKRPRRPRYFMLSGSSSTASDIAATAPAKSSARSHAWARRIASSARSAADVIDVLQELSFTAISLTPTF